MDNTKDWEYLLKLDQKDLLHEIYNKNLQIICSNEDQVNVFLNRIATILPKLPRSSELLTEIKVFPIIIEFKSISDDDLTDGKSAYVNSFYPYYNIHTSNGGRDVILGLQKIQYHKWKTTLLPPDIQDKIIMENSIENYKNKLRNS